MTGTLPLVPALTRPDLLAAPVTAALRGWAGERPVEQIAVAEIDPDLADTAAFCDRYGVPPDASANCVVVTGKRDGEVRYAACVVLSTTRADVNGVGPPAPRRPQGVLRRHRRRRRGDRDGVRRDHPDRAAAGLAGAGGRGGRPAPAGGHRQRRPAVQAVAARAGARRAARHRGRRRPRPPGRRDDGRRRHRRGRGGVPPRRARGPGASPRRPSGCWTSPPSWAASSSRSCRAPRWRRRRRSAASWTSWPPRSRTAAAACWPRPTGPGSAWSRPARCRAPPARGQPAYPKARYERLVAEYAEVGREQLVCAMQVQVGVPDRELAVAALPRLAPWLPVLLALSGSSPFYAGHDTGYASYRAVIWSRWPTGGPPLPFASAAEYDSLVADLVDVGHHRRPGDGVFRRPAVRPLPDAGGPGVRLGAAAGRRGDAGRPGPGAGGDRDPDGCRRAGRPGRSWSAPAAGGRPGPAWATCWSTRAGRGRCRPARWSARCWSTSGRRWTSSATPSGCSPGWTRWSARGTARADRQRAVYARRERLADVVDALVAETRAGL